MLQIVLRDNKFEIKKIENKDIIYNSKIFSGTFQFYLAYEF